MEVFRLCREQYTNTLDGKGAAINGGRWNSRGTELIYTAANWSLAMAEILVHLSLAALPEDFYMMTILIPDDMPVSEIYATNLQIGWNSFPHIVSTRMIGDKFVYENWTCILKVPSAVTKGDFNYLINPHHPRFKDVKINEVEKFPFDRRIFRS
jgi:RES domain-containing protein